jgi:hypothetical protein
VTRTLSPDRWEQIRTAFDEIVDLDTARRDQRLKTIGAKDPELRSSLEALLQADARANAWLAPVESPLGFVPPAEEMSTPPNAKDAPLAQVSLTRRRWLMIAVVGVALAGAGVVVVSAIARRSGNTEADWGAPAAPPVVAASNFNLVGVNLRGEERPLVDIARDGGSLWPSVLDTAYFAWPKISPDGRRIAVEVRTGDGRWDIWVYDLPSRSLTRLTDGFTGVKPFGWSSDSRNLIYLAVDDEEIGWTNRVVSQQWDGSAPPRQLLRTDSPIFDVALGPLDGDAVIRGIGGNDDLWIGPVRDAGALRPFVVTRALEVDLRLSRDGQLLAYASNETGQFEIYVLPLSDPSRRVQVSRGGGTQPVWSPDGRQLFYRSPDRMMRATVRRGGRLTVERVEPLFADTYERHDVTNYDVFPSGEELVMIRARSR